MIGRDNARYLVVLVFALVLTAAGTMLSDESITGYATDIISDELGNISIISAEAPKENYNLNNDIQNISITISGRDYSIGNNRSSYAAYFRSLSSDVNNRPVAVVKDNYIITFSPQDKINLLPKKATKTGDAGNRVQSFAVTTANEVIYPNQYEEIGSSDGFANLSYRYYDEQVKENLVIWNRDYLQSRFDSQCNDDDYVQVNLVFSNVVRAYHVTDLDNQTMGVVFGNDRTSFKEYGLPANDEQTTSERIDFTDDTGDSIYYVPELYAEDSAGARILLNKTISMTAFGNLKIDVLTPFSWLNDSSRVYPVYIDPSIITANQTLKKITYHVNDIELNVTLYKNISYVWQNEVDDIWMTSLTSGYKFGANDTSATENARYKYTWEANQEILKDGIGYYFILEENQGGALGNRAHIHTDDICANVYNQTLLRNFTVQERIANLSDALLFEPNCTFTHNSNILEVEFTSQYNETLGMTIIDPAYEISACQEIDSAGTYTLTDNIEATGTCFNITADNVTLDGAGFSIDGGDSGYYYGVYAEGRDNITVKNFVNISNFYWGVWFLKTNNSFIENANVAGSNYLGIGLQLSSNDLLTNVTANSNERGIILSISPNNNLTNITANENDANGFWLDTNSHNNIITNITANSNLYGGIVLGYGSDNNIFTNVVANDNAFEGILILYSHRNIFRQGSISNTTNVNRGGIYLFNGASSNNFFQDFIINTTNTYNVFLDTESHNNNTFLNVSYIGINQSELVTGGELIRKWYLDVNVTDFSDNSALENANVTAWNITGEEQFSELTAASGLITTQEATQYENIGGTVVYINYTVNATLIGYISNSTQANITGNTLLNISMEIDSTPPVMSLHNISVTHPNNVSVLFNSTDATATDTMHINDTANFEMNKTGFLWNITDLAPQFPALYWLNISANDSSNNTASVEIWINITDTTAPAMSLHNISVTHPNNVSVLFNFTDSATTDIMHINDTTNFEMNKTGSLINISYLSAGEHWLNISANDTMNNTAWDNIWVNVSSTASTTTTANPDQPPARGGGATTTSVTTTVTSTVGTTTTIPPITTIELEDTGNLPTVSWSEIYEMITEPITNLLVEPPKASVFVSESSSIETQADLKSSDDKGIQEMIIVSEGKEVSGVNCSNAVICRWIKEFEKQEQNKEYNLIIVSATGSVTERAFDIMRLGHPEQQGLTGEKLIFGFRMSTQWLFVLIILLGIFYLMMRTTFHVLKLKGKIKVTKYVSKKDISKVMHGKVIAIRHAFKRKKKPKKKKRPIKEIIKSEGVKLFKPAPSRVNVHMKKKRK